MTDRFKVSFLNKERVNEALTGEIMGNKNTGELGIKSPKGNYISYSGLKRFNDHMKIAEVRSRKHSVTGMMNVITPDMKLPNIVNSGVNIISEAVDTPLRLSVDQVKKLLLSVDVDSFEINDRETSMLSNENKLSVNFLINGVSDNYSLDHTILSSTDNILTVHISKNNKKMAIGGTNGVYLYNIKTDGELELVTSMVGFYSNVVSMSDDGLYLAYFETDAVLRVMNTNTFAFLNTDNTVIPVGNPIKSLKISSDNSSIYFTKDDKVYVCQVNFNDKTVSLINQHQLGSTLTSLNVLKSNGEDLVFIGSRSTPFMKVYKNLVSTYNTVDIQSPGFVVNDIFINDSLIILVGENGIALYRFISNEIKFISKHTLSDTITSVSVNGTKSVLGSNRGVYFFDITQDVLTLEDTHIVENPTDVKSVHYNPDNSVLLVQTNVINEYKHKNISQEVTIQDNIHDFNSKPISIKELINNVSVADEVYISEIKIVNNELNVGKTIRNIVHSLIVVSN